VFGEIFGMPIRIARTGSRDPNDKASIEKMMQLMGAAGWAVLPEGTEIDIKETTRGDAFNVYDKRIERCNSEMAKGILGQTMTTDNGGSLAQSEVHLEILKNIVYKDADFLRDIINWKLLPFMAMHGFPVQDLRFSWDDSVDWTPEQQLRIEQMLLGSYNIDPKYFAEKYNIPVTGTKSPLLSLQNDFFV
jgi:phage gp29-like protein